MTRDEVRKLMHDYFDELLSAEERSTIESYLEEYDDLVNEYDLLKKLLEKAQSLPIGIKTPDTVLDKISDELLSKSLQKIETNKQQRLRELTEQTEREGEKRKKLPIKKNKSKTDETYTNEKSKRNFPTKPFVLLLVLIIGVGGYFAYDYFFKTNLPWKLKAEYGQYQIGQNISNEKTLDEKEILSTLDSTKVSVNIPNAGRIDVGSFTTLQLIKGKDSDNIISLIGGKIYAECKIERPSLTVKTGPVDIVAKSGDFSVKLDEQGNVNVQTGNGIVKLSNKKEELLLVQDHNCKVLSTGKIGIPYHINADPALVDLVLKVSFEGDQTIDLQQLLNLATPLDGITLLYLIKETTNKAEKLSVFLKLNEFYPVPPGITQEGIINLDPTMFDTWRKDIEWQI